jgi:hypothetical protein
MAMESSELRALLRGYTGTVNWWRHPVFNHFTYTDGARAFFQHAEAWWFFDIIATELTGRYAKKNYLDAADGILFIELRVRGGRAMIVAHDGKEEDENLAGRTTLYTRLIEFTDCPEGDWKFQIEGDPADPTLLLPSEH